MSSDKNLKSSSFIELRNISKVFPGVKALDNIELTLLKGEVHCLAGQNGCGKSTLIKIISGMYKPESGASIIIDGVAVKNLSPLESIRRGIQVIYQDLSLFPNLTIAENIAIQQHLDAGLTVNWKDIYSKAVEVVQRLGLNLDLTQKVSELSISEQQLVAICRAIAADAKLVIMDEPTASLTRVEVNNLLSVVRDLKSRGICIVFVSHKLDEVMEVADRVTVIRDGVKQGTWPANELDDKILARLMTGMEFDFKVMEPIDRKGEPLLKLRNLSLKGQYQDVTLDVYPGEILGITGLLDSGRTELALSIFGMNPADSGSIFLDGQAVKLLNNRQALDSGIAYVSEDRMSTGLIMTQSISDNTTVTVLDRLKSRFNFLDHEKKASVVNDLVKKLTIKVSDINAPVSTLSGGNAQRIAIAKWVATNPKVLILDSPTVGVDIANKEGIYRIVRELSSQGIAIIMISDEVSEVFYQCHRVLVMSKGRIVDEIIPANTSEQQLGELVNA